MSKIDDLIQELCPNGVPFERLEKHIDYVQPGKYIVSSTEYTDKELTPVLTAGKSFLLGYTDDNEGIYPASKEEPVIIFDDFTTSSHLVDFPFKVKSSALKILKPKQNSSCNIIFLYYLISQREQKPLEHSRQWISTFSKIKVPIPPREVQDEIVDFIQKIAQLEAELEAELEARRQQYEYYRDKLLTFKELPKENEG